MDPNASVRFFDQQFRQQLARADLHLNPFELAALPHLRGRVLDYGCGLGNLALAAAQRGCSVLALDASPAAIGHLREAARAASLPIDAAEEDLRNYLLSRSDDFPAPNRQLKCFVTIVARKPNPAEATSSS